MGIGKFFGGENTPRVIEEDIFSLYKPEDPELEEHVLAEPLTLMGSSKPSPHDPVLVTLNPGDRITLSSPVSLGYDQHGYDVKIARFNEENPNIAEVFYFKKNELEGRKIKLVP